VPDSTGMPGRGCNPEGIPEPMPGVEIDPEEFEKIPGGEAHPGVVGDVPVGEGDPGRGALGREGG
jgi:hypothetical protein